MSVKKFIAKEWLFVLKIVAVAFVVSVLSIVSTSIPYEEGVSESTEKIERRRLDSYLYLHNHPDDRKVDQIWYSPLWTKEQYERATKEKDAYTIGWVKRHPEIQSFQITYPYHWEKSLGEAIFGSDYKAESFGLFIVWLLAGGFYTAVWLVRSIRWAIRTSRKKE